MSSETQATEMKPVYLAYIQKMRETGIERSERLQQEWLHRPEEFRGPEPRHLPGALAIIDAFLYSVTGEASYAENAASLLADNDYSVFDYIQAYREVSDSPAMTPELRSKIEDRIANLADMLIEHHVEWGAMNHATNYIVNGMAAAAQILPDHPRNSVWTQFSEKMLATSWGKWGIEDSQNYSPIWLTPLVHYADLTGRREFFDMPTTIYYFHYYVNLLSPAGIIPEFGDGGWAGSWERFVCLLERGAAEYRNGEMKFAARQMFEACRNVHKSYENSMHGDYSWGLAFAGRLTEAYRWADDSVEERVPTTGSREVLEDYIGKKVVFRNGWDSRSTYMLLNYMDVPSFGVDGRDELRTTIPVESEKTHHGHADENTICMLMSRGAVLLGNSGYRETDTTGPSGEFRADTFHNRLVARPGIVDPQMRLLPFLLDAGRYRFVTTKSLHFHNLRAVDVSRTRLTDQDRGYQWDRVVAYLKDLDSFVMVDVVKVLKDGEYTFANLLYGQQLVETNHGLYHVKIDDVGGSTPQLNSDAATLAIYYPDRRGKRDGVEQIRRAYQNHMCVYQSESNRYEAGQYVAFTTALIPLDRGEDPEPRIRPFEHVAVSDGAPGVALRIRKEDGYIMLCVKFDPEAAFLEENVRPQYTFESGRSRYGDLETDARFAYLDVSPDKVAYSFVEATKLFYAGKELFASPSMKIRQDDGTYQRMGAIRWRAWEDEMPRE